MYEICILDMKRVKDLCLDLFRMFALLHVDLCGGFISHHGHSHGHKHNEPHETELSVNNNLINLDNERNFQPTKPKENINIRAAIIHTIGDFIQSIGVLIAAILIKVKV